MDDHDMVNSHSERQRRSRHDQNKEESRDFGVMKMVGRKVQ